jgi:NAD(P)-dependent dehydrogenase (short-subunit alcohol dehydrogenase family)
MRLENRAALITGGTSGIGEATSLLFGREGAKVAVVGRSAERGERVAEQIRSDGGEAIFVRSDVRKVEDCRNAVTQTVEAFGRLDVLFNNAGTYYANDTVGCTEEEWDDQVMTKAMAIDHGAQGIRVNAVCPGDTDTPMEREDARAQGLTWDEYVEAMTGGRPIARMATPDEIARAVLFLASDESSYVTGAALPVDGGGVAG